MRFYNAFINPIPAVSGTSFRNIIPPDLTSTRIVSEKPIMSILFKNCVFLKTLTKKPVILFIDARNVKFIFSA